MFFKLASTLCLAFAVAQGAPSAPSSYGAPPPAPPPSYGEPPPPPPPQPAYGAPTAPQPTYVAAGQAEPAAPEPTPPYAFNYAVLDAESGNDFSAEEQAQGGIVSGEYKVKLADGKIMTVSYTVEGDSGFVADIVTELPEASTGDGAGSGYGAPAPLAQYLPSYAK
ncbi:unnamed protein product [Lepeophtheirus salmonis]|nr:unnamed protein product [Lepeophtheirus salmonis]CAB4059615.1 unnamed protein product [Lepeophtheirus salmonis]CAF2851277.1 unnamed protein product [Lepeophtheirus salmonis]CAF2851306.1 unnamed protein product [Lepeophtheirus salmonis]